MVGVPGQVGGLNKKAGRAVAVIIFLAGSFVLGSEACKLAAERERPAVAIVQQAPAESSGLYNAICPDRDPGSTPAPKENDGFYYDRPDAAGDKSEPGNPADRQVPGEAQHARAAPEAGQPESRNDNFTGSIQLPVEKPPSQAQAGEPLKEQDTGLVVFVYDGDTVQVRLAKSAG